MISPFPPAGAYFNEMLIYLSSAKKTEEIITSFQPFNTDDHQHVQTHHPLHRRQDMCDGHLYYEIGEIFSNTPDIEESLNQVLDCITARAGFTRIMIHLGNQQGEEFVVDLFRGYSKEEISKGNYRPGEGVIGSVIQSGRLAVIPSIEKSSEFLNKTGSRNKNDCCSTAFICVPVRVNNVVIGTISVDIQNESLRSDFSEETSLLAFVAIMSAQSIKNRIDFLRNEEALLEENKKLQIKLKERSAASRIIGDSKLMHEVFEKIYLVAETNTIVLIRGESGTGKELVADEIVANSRRGDKPFIKVNVAALPESLIESELFGHERGAFTGAISQKKGRFELANTGTIFLDEIGDLSYPLQVKLLRVLQERVIERVGASTQIPLDVRVIAATHQNLEEKIEKKEFRSDLYYRLNVFPLHLPPLRERSSDVLTLADFFVEKYAKETGKNINRISTEAINLLVAYHWPGNVRELENCIERAVIMSTETVIRSYHLPPTLQMAEGRDASKGSLESMVDRYEKEIIIDILKTTGGNITQAAQILNSTKRILSYKVKKLDIDFRLFKSLTPDEK